MQDPVYAADFERLAELCRAHGAALQTIKSIALARWDGREQTANTWYEPLTEQEDIDLAVHWVLGNAQVFLNTVGDLELLPKVLDAASRFESRPADDAVAALGAVPLFS
jgi:cell division inhibitor SulA